VDKRKQQGIVSNIFFKITRYLCYLKQPLKLNIMTTESKERELKRPDTAPNDLLVCDLGILAFPSDFQEWYLTKGF
jgi:hypothetical protein